LDAERLLWVEARGARGGHPDGHECDERQQDRDDDESGRIPGFYAEEEAGEEAREPEGGAESDGDADESQSHAMADDEIADARAVGAEGHANAHLLRALLHGIGHQAVNPDRGEDERGGSEDG